MVDQVMGADILQFIISAAVIVVAGIFLTRFADVIADLTGLGRLLIGSVLLAGATSLPELAVDINAIVQLDQPDLAVGALVGSCLFNLLILGILDVTQRPRRLTSNLAEAHALSATMTIALTALAGIAIMARLGVHLFGIGVGSFLVLAGYIFGIRIVFFDQQLAAKLYNNNNNTHQEPEPTPPPVGRVVQPSLVRAFVGFAVCAAVIVLAAPYTARSADQIAETSGLGRTFVGTSLVAFSTSLPELVATAAAMRMRAFDLALGNIFGSNSFNILLLVVLDVIYTRPLLSVVSETHVLTCLAVILVTTVAVMGQLYQVEKRGQVLDPGPWMIMVLVVIALVMVYYLGDDPSEIVARAKATG